jgi:hypothetical protein
MQAALLGFGCLSWELLARSGPLLTRSGGSPVRPRVQPDDNQPDDNSKVPALCAERKIVLLHKTCCICTKPTFAMGLPFYPPYSSAAATRDRTADCNSSAECTAEENWTGISRTCPRALS